MSHFIVSHCSIDLLFSNKSAAQRSVLFLKLLPWFIVWKISSFETSPKFIQELITPIVSVGNNSTSPVAKEIMLYFYCWNISFAYCLNSQIFKKIITGTIDVKSLYQLPDLLENKSQCNCFLDSSATSIFKTCRN